MDIRFPAGLVAATDGPGGRARDHRRIVRAVRERKESGPHVAVKPSGHFLLEAFAEEGVGSDASGENDGAGLVRLAASAVFTARGSTTASWNEAARSAIGHPGGSAVAGVRGMGRTERLAHDRPPRVPAMRSGSVRRSSAVLRPEKLKSACRAARRGAARTLAGRRGGRLPEWRGRRGSRAPSSRAPLSNASPAASSSVRPRC